MSALSQLPAPGDDDDVVLAPALVKGDLVLPAMPSRAELDPPAGPDGRPASVWLTGADQPSWVLRRPVLDRSTLLPVGRDQFLVLPAVPPARLVEDEPERLARGLYALPFDEVLEYAAGLGELLRPGGALAKDVAAHAAATSWVDDAVMEQFFATLPHLFDPAGIAELVDRELGSGDGPGRRYLDGWCPVRTRAHRGATARTRDQLHSWPAVEPGVPAVRAMPTRQLHITAGNAPIVPFVSFLRALATKGAAVVKSPAGATFATTLLASAMRELDPDHPITRHTSLVYWRGGERQVEDVLFARGAFDRLVMWGSAEAVGSVTTRAEHTRQVLLRPRVGMSLIGREALGERVEDVAARAAADTMIANQAACTSSLVHYVEATRAEAEDYCRALCDALARWDRALPHVLPPDAAGRLRRLKRGELATGTWFENGRWPHVTSAVVCLLVPFDLSAHPAGRFVVVRPVPDLEVALRFLHAGVSTVGVYPEQRRMMMRDALAARGVSTVLPLGETEQAYPGMPHDGMRVLSELVDWVNS